MLLLFPVKAGQDLIMAKKRTDPFTAAVCKALGVTPEPEKTPEKPRKRPAKAPERAPDPVQASPAPAQASPDHVQANPAPASVGSFLDELLPQTPPYKPWAKTGYATQVWNGGPAPESLSLQVSRANPFADVSNADGIICAIFDEAMDSAAKVFDAQYQECVQDFPALALGADIRAEIWRGMGQLEEPLEKCLEEYGTDRIKEHMEIWGKVQKRFLDLLKGIKDRDLELTRQDQDWLTGIAELASMFCTDQDGNEPDDTEYRDTLKEALLPLGIFESRPGKYAVSVLRQPATVYAPVQWGPFPTFDEILTMEGGLYEDRPTLWLCKEKGRIFELRTDISDGSVAIMYRETGICENSKLRPDLTRSEWLPVSHEGIPIPRPIL